MTDEKNETTDTTTEEQVLRYTKEDTKNLTFNEYIGSLLTSQISVMYDLYNALERNFFIDIERFLVEYKTVVLNLFFSHLRVDTQATTDQENQLKTLEINLSHMVNHCREVGKKLKEAKTLAGTTIQ